ncbi:hypothetical protein [Streptomyces sp. NPDC046862]|uniref:hypothetical protein n=1 Tax=Streptomyces sp. NPDC046862 TaxID=3154603 RepID=UPI00345357B9
MNVFGDKPDPGPDERLAGLEEHTCVWCVQLRDTDARAGQTPTAGKRPPAPWMVPLGLPPRPARTDR